jgi:hypothetical protein
LNSSFHNAAYHLAGLRIVSDVPLSGLLHSDPTASGEVVTIRRGRVPKTLSDPVMVQDNIAYDGSSLLLTIPKVARFLVGNGNEILVDPEPSAHKNDVRAYLLSCVFATLCYQRGILPLHSAAIDVTDGCIAIIGDSRAGKSTLAAALTAHGHQVIADDVSFLRLDSDGNVMSWPGIGRIRLWEDAVAALGLNGPEVEQEFSAYTKYLVPVPPPKDPFAPRRLRRIYHLNAAPDGIAAKVSQITSPSAIEVLMQNAYCSYLAEYMGRKPAIFALCVAMARQVPVFQFSRPMGFEVLDQGIEALEDHLRDNLLEPMFK